MNVYNKAYLSHAAYSCIVNNALDSCSSYAAKHLYKCWCDIANKHVALCYLNIHFVAIHV